MSVIPATKIINQDLSLDALQAIFDEKNVHAVLLNLMSIDLAVSQESAFDRQPLDAKKGSVIDVTLVSDTLVKDI